MRFSRLFAAAGVFLLTAACAPAPAPTTPPAQSGGQAPPAQTAPQPFTLRIGHASLQATLDAQAIIGVNPRRYGLYDGLLNQDENGKLIPGLATEWKSINPTTWQFKLAQGRKWSDGTAVTADDIKFSWDRAINPANRLGITGRLGTLDKAEIVDPQTINLVTKTPDGLLPKRAAAVAMMQKAFLEKTSPADLAVKAIGTGPFMVKEFIPADRLVVVPNPNSPSKPIASEVIIRAVPEASARIAGLRSGELDLISAVPVGQAEQLKTAGNQLHVFDRGNSYGAIIFTTIPESPTSNKLVRQAMNYAIDKDAIVKNIYGNLTKPSGQLAQPTTTGYNPNIKPYSYDVAKAKQLLAQAGYANGFKTKIDVFASSAEATAFFLYVQDAFKQIGIEAEIQSSTDPQFNTDRFYGRVARSPILSQGLSNSPALDADFSISWFYGKRIESERWFNNAAFDAAYEASTAELDEAKRTTLLQQAMQILHEEAPFLFAVDNFALWASSASLGNVIVRGDSEPRFDLITKK